jgi:DNA-binding transcriptional regulator YbjK
MAAATAQRRPRPRGAARREALLEAVLRIVADTGPDAVTHRRVAEVAELPLASTTYWFSSKDELLAAALELAAERDIEAVRGRAAALGGEPPLEAAVAVICHSLNEGLRSSRGSLIAAYALWLEAARRPELRALNERWTAVYHETVAGLLARAGSADPLGDARLLLAAADGLIMEQLAAGSSSDVRPSLRRVAKALLERS